jgi:hypothetical protein
MPKHKKTVISTDEMATSSQTQTSRHLPYKPMSAQEITLHIQKQTLLAHSEYLRLKELLSPLGYSDMAIRKQAQSYKISHKL